VKVGASQPDGYSVSKRAASKDKVFLLVKKAVMLAVTLVEVRADFLSLHFTLRGDVT